MPIIRRTPYPDDPELYGGLHVPPLPVFKKTHLKRNDKSLRRIYRRNPHLEPWRSGLSVNVRTDNGTTFLGIHYKDALTGQLRIRSWLIDKSKPLCDLSAYDYVGTFNSYHECLVTMMRLNGVSF